MAGELRWLVGGLDKCLDLSSGDGAGEGGLLHFTLLPADASADEVGQGSGREIQLGSNPGADTVVTIFISISQFQNLVHSKEAVLRVGAGKKRK